MEVHSQLLSLLNKKSKNFEDKKKIVFLIKENDLRMHDVSIEYGLDLLKNYKSKLGYDCKLNLILLLLFIIL